MMGEEEVDDLRSEVCTLESRLEDALSDLRRWEARAYDSEGQVHADKITIGNLEYEIDCLKGELADAEERATDSGNRADEFEADLNEAHESYHDLEVEHDRRAYERDCYKAVLEGMEFIEIDSYPEKGHEFCRRLGVEAKEIMERVLNKSLEKR